VTAPPNFPNHTNALLVVEYGKKKPAETSKPGQNPVDENVRLLSLCPLAIRRLRPSEPVIGHAEGGPMDGLWGG
jgi:hypothetical protein